MKKIGQKLIQHINSILLSLILVAVIVALALAGVTLHHYQNQIEELRYQLTYLQDTANVIQTNVGNMESNVEAALQEEGSLLEDLSIELADCNFAEGTYDVKVSVVPKDYTDTMKASIFFGTREYQLKFEDFAYQGELTLPLNVKYEGNVIVLFTDGSRRSTEVRKEYTDVQRRFDKVLSGNIGKIPDFIDGNLIIDNSVYYDLNTNDRWTFTRFEVVVEVDDSEVYTQDLSQSAKNAEESEESEDGALDEDSDAEPRADADADSRIVSRGSGDADSRMASRGGGDADSSIASRGGADEDSRIVSWGSADDNEPEMSGWGQDAPLVSITSNQKGEGTIQYTGEALVGSKVRIYLRAVTEDGYTFTYDLFNGYTASAGDGFAESASSFTRHYDIYDDKGGCWNVY